ncbi:hypothetical protein RCH09_003429 [Actimicrobium sp. GrIS 1.19]|uniref:hypothetical protein n=1 Tax=Actimicrobium sp. GrIS 1.19 TaxID=3071708 RepID=UPI002DFFBBDB|nr:hypothetical protein [Actimicrobium sp. GrIS 1.19]
MNLLAGKMNRNRPRQCHISGRPGACDVAVMRRACATGWRFALTAMAHCRNFTGMSYRSTPLHLLLLATLSLALLRVTRR